MTHQLIEQLQAAGAGWLTGYSIIYLWHQHLRDQWHRHQWGSHVWDN